MARKIAPTTEARITKALDNYLGLEKKQNDHGHTCWELVHKDIWNSVTIKIDLSYGDLYFKVRNSWGNAGLQTFEHPITQFDGMDEQTTANVLEMIIRTALKLA